MAVGDQLAALVIEPNARAGVAGEAEHEQIAALGSRRGDCLRDQPDLATRLRHAAVDDPAAVGIEIEEAAAEQREREDVDREDPRGEADAVRPFERKVALVIRPRSDNRRHTAFQ
jgi:hypothetical protein